MANLRLIRVLSGELTEHGTEDSPPYLAISHVWAEHVFTVNIQDLHVSWGWAAVLCTVSKLFPNVEYCWIDTLCILQDDARDKHQQIQLMGSIFGNAVAVIIMLDRKLQISQKQIDHATEAVAGAVQMHLDESWNENDRRWTTNAGRRAIADMMELLAEFTTTGWSTRVWTLQEYVLAQHIVWIGQDLVPVSVDDILFAAIPDVCDSLGLDEFLGGRFSLLYTHFQGMINCRLKRNDQTRIMELLGNRAATIPADEVFGVMAASGVVIPSSSQTTRDEAWRAWWQMAVTSGHMRWVMLPVHGVDHTGLGYVGGDCVMPPFAVRHNLSASACLDTVPALGHVSISSGTVTLTARNFGICTPVRRLGRVCETGPRRVNRELTLVLFGAGNIRLGHKLAWAFGGGRYRQPARAVIAKILSKNFRRALLAIARGTEDNFTARRLAGQEDKIWTDFMQFQMSQMIGINENVAYLALLESAVISTYVAFGSREGIQLGVPLSVLDLNAVCGDERRVFLVADSGSVGAPTSSGQCDEERLDSAWHKIGTTLPQSVPAPKILEQLALTQVRLGGSHCHRCSQESQGQTRETSNSRPGARPRYLDPAPRITRARIRRMLLPVQHHRQRQRRRIMFIR